MADIAVKENEHRITLERLKGYFPLLSRTEARIQPFLVTVINKQKDLYELWSKTTLADSNKPDIALANAIIHPDTSTNSAELEHILTTVQESLGDNSNREKAYETSRLFKKSLDEMNTFFKDEFRDDDSSVLANLRNDFLTQWTSLQVAILDSRLQTVWVAYPLFFKRYVAAVNAFDAFLDAKIDQELGALGDLREEKDLEEIKALREKKKKERESLGSNVPFFAPPSSRNTTSETNTDQGGSTNQTQTKTQLMLAKYEGDLTAVNRLIGSLDRMETPITWEQFLDKYSSNFAVLRDSKADALIKPLIDAFALKSKNNGWDKLPKDILPPRTEDVQKAQDIVQKATLENNGPLSRQQIDSLIASLPIFPETFLSELLAQSRQISAKNSSTESTFSHSDLPESLQRELRLLPFSNANVEQIETAYKQIQSEIKSGKIQTTAEVKNRLLVLLPREATTIHTAIETSLQSSGVLKEAPGMQSGQVKRYESLDLLLGDEDAKSETWLLEQRLDSVALALLITTVASNNRTKVDQSIQSAIDALARTDVNFSLSLKSAGFRNSVVNELTQRVQFLQARSLLTANKILATNAFIRSSDPASFSKVLLVIEAMGGSEAALSVLLLTRPQLQKKIESLQNISRGALVLPASSQIQSSSPTGSAKSDDLSVRMSSAEMRLWQMASGKEKVLSADEFVTSQLPTGKENKAERAYLLTLYTQIINKKSVQDTLARRIEILQGALTTQEKIAKEYKFDIDTQPLQKLMFVGMTPDDTKAYFEQLLSSNQGVESSYQIGMDQNIYADDPRLMQDTSGWRRIAYRDADQQQRKQKSALTTIAQNSRFFTNPAVLGAVGTGLVFAGGVGTFLAGAAANAPWVSALGGAVAGGAVGSVVPFIGTTIGAIGGGIAGYFGGSALANQINGTGLTSLSRTFETANLAAKGVGNLAPGTFVNASTSLSGSATNLGNTLGGVVNSTMAGTSNALAGISTVAPGLNVAGAVLIPVGIVGVTAFLTTTIGINGAFIMQGDIASCQKSEGISVCKTSDVTQSLNPVDVTYTIEIKADAGKTAVIDAVSDTMVVRKSTQGDPPAPPTLSPEAQQALDSLKGSVDSNTSKKAQYTVKFGSEFADTQIINTLVIGYSGVSVKTTATVIFGEVKYGEGCWPTTGTITQGPFAPKTHCHIDSIDIFANDEGGPNAPIFSPFDGTAEFFCLKDTCPYVYSLPIYGNAVRLTLNENGFNGKPKVIMFGHMSRFTDQFHAGQKVQITKGTQLGFMGNSGSGMAGSGGTTADFSEHLHYEYVNNTRRLCTDPMPPSQLLEDGIVPQEVTMGDQWPRRVPETQRVRYDACGSSTSSPGAPVEGKIEATVSCFSFVDGNKTWTPAELTQYKGEMTKLLQMPNVDNALCGDGKNIQIIRHDTDPNRTDDGCNFDGTGEAGAEWVNNNLQVCDKLFADTSGTFGVYTMWHEPGHALKNKHPELFTQFPDFGPNYLESYPLNKTKAEDFPESFGLCYYNLNQNRLFMTDQTISASYRGKTIVYANYNKQCTAIKNAVDSVPKAPGGGF